MIAYDGPNADQIRLWNEVQGPQWVALDKPLTAQIRPFGLRALDWLSLKSGERVLDVGCGGGETTVEIGRRVGSTGRVLGVDISEPLAAHARQSASDLPHVEVRVADAQIAPFDEHAFDVIFSRFGVMFFADPLAAFSNLLTALRPGGRMAFVCWRALQENPWMAIPAMVTAKHVPMKRPDPHAPGPFAFADADRIRQILDRAGFADVRYEPINEHMHVAGDEPLDGAVTMLMRSGPTGSALREANAPAELVDTVRKAIREAIAPFEKQGSVIMPSAAWLFTATRT